MKRARATLAGALLREGDPIELPVFGSSMQPRLRAGDLVTVEPARAGALRRGDLVAVERVDGLVVHRLVRRQAGHLILCGDSCPAADPPLPESAVLGRVVAIRRQGRVRRLDGAWGRFGEAAYYRCWYGLRAFKFSLGWMRSRIAFPGSAAHSKER